jgi:hypothetical protein
LFGDGFRSSIISLNSESEICISPFTNFCAANGKRLARIHQSKVALIGFIIQPFPPFQFGRLVCWSGLFHSLKLHNKFRIVVHFLNYKRRKTDCRWRMWCNRRWTLLFFKNRRIRIKMALIWGQLVEDIHEHFLKEVVCF